PMSYLHENNLAGLQGAYDLSKMFVGLIGGSMGEVSSLLLILGGLFLIWRKVITWYIPVSYIGTVAALTFLFPRGNDPVQWMLYNLLGGGLMLGAFFMATDYVTSPVSHLGQAIFGIGCGLITVFIRYFGSYSEGVCYAILIMNLTVWIIDKNVKPRRFGVVKEKKPARAPDNTKKEAAKK
ncbi:MAG: RnfABCDGE type electron transport complex subunit D, partial [Oscillospiraceae bacterium]|nr:RnfABCDGE type electron transport complex subunit D [Oscillospiraceae bacterium]